MQYHNSISSEYWLTGWIVLLGSVGYFILLFAEGQELPPLISVISICMLILLNVFQIAYALQIAKNVDDMAYLLYVYHLNILILSARVIHRHIREQVEYFRDKANGSDDHFKGTRYQCVSR